MTTVLESTVSTGFCCGCGICAGICPSQTLEMQWNKFGEYNPVKIKPCPNECGLCVKVCPFANGNDNEDVLGANLFQNFSGVQHRSETGYYLSSGVGAVADEERRMSSSSGGLATWFLEELLKKKVVDAVICVEHSDDGKRLFRFHAATTPEEIRASTGSVYYPVELSEMIRFIQTHPGRYAIIGLPCVLKGLRLAQERFSYLRERIVMLIGLACSNLKSSHFVEYAAYRSGLKEEIASCSFRYKSYALPRNFFKLRFKGVNGAETEKDWGGADQLWKMYLGRCCTLHSCDCCDDMHAECADVTFMDAWLREYSNEPRGTSLWIARSPLADRMLSQGIVDKKLDAESISIDKVILAQDSIRWKRELLKYRLLLMKERGEICPEKRVKSGRGALTILERDQCRKALEIQRESRVRYNDGFEAFGKWFDVTYKNRPFYIRIYNHSLAVLVYVYHLFRKVTKGINK